MISCINHQGEWVKVPKHKFKFRPSVYGLIRSGDEICVCTAKSSGTLWFPGGGVEVGETLRQALEREIEEETGMKGVEIGRQLGVLENFFYYEPTDEAMHSYLFFYECQGSKSALKDNANVLDDDATDFRWVPIRSLKESNFSNLQKELLDLIGKMEQTALD